MDLENALEQVEYGLTNVFNDLADAASEAAALEDNKARIKYTERATTFEQAASGVTALRKGQFAALGDKEEQRLYGLTNLFNEAVDAALETRFEGTARRRCETNILDLAATISEFAEKHRAKAALPEL